MRISLKKYCERQQAKEKLKDEKYSKWHSWWAWRPILIDDEIMLFEHIHRRRDAYGIWRYKHLMDFLKEEY